MRVTLGGCMVKKLKSSLRCVLLMSINIPQGV